MSPESWIRLEELFHRAAALPRDERAGFLESTCADQPGLRAELERMLAAEEGDSRIEGAVEAGLGWVRDEADAPPSHIGPYRVLREIGRGGLATVYLAERADEQFDMRVAIKVVRRGMDTADILKRLRRERQILARLNHPNIARLLDGGTTEAGVPYFVMEHIVGRRIDEYCRDKRLSLEERLSLFRQVCSAVDYAHRNLVLHRDLKPSNLLVTDDGVPKLLDFGIAKVLDPDDTSTASPLSTPLPEPTLTRTGLHLLTPSYASPEQVRGEPLSTASDVYSLGMLLYLLLADRLPYEIQGRRRAEIERIVCESRIDAPSHALARKGRGEPTQGRSASSHAIRPRDLQGDLDTVVLASLRKEPPRRYQSAAELAEDLRRYLEALPVRARRDTVWYRTGKFVHRHRLSVAAVLLVKTLLLTAVWVALHQAQVAREALAAAETAHGRSEFQANFLVDLFEASDPWQRPGADITATQMLEIGSRQIEALAKNDPPVAGALMETMGRTYQHRNQFDRARQLLERSLDERLRHFGPWSLEVAKSRRALGKLSFEKGDLVPAERQLIIALDIFSRRLGEHHTEVAATLYEQAGVLLAAGRWDESELGLRRSLEIYRRAGEGHGLEKNEVQNRLAEVLFQQGRVSEAEAIFRSVLDQRRHLGEHPDLAVSLNNLAVVRNAQGRNEEAGALFEEALEHRRILFGSQHSDVAQSLYNLAMFRLGQRQLGGVEPLFTEALDIHRRLFSGEHPSEGDYLYGLGLLRYSEGQYGPAAELFQQALELRRRTLGEHVRVFISLRKLAEVEALRGRLEIAERHYLLAADLHDRLFDDDDPRGFSLWTDIGALRIDMGKPRSAIEPLARAVEGLRSHADYGPKHWQTAWAEAQLGRAWLLDGRTRDGSQLIEQSLETMRASLGEEHWRPRRLQEWLESARSKPNR